MHRNELLELLATHTPADASEEVMWLNTIRFVKEHLHCFDRKLEIGHITASAWIISPDHTQVLLMHHAKLNKWFQPGGHCDGDPDVQKVAAKEAIEETGVSVRLVESGILDVDVHRIPANAREVAHDHYDIRFLFYADPAQIPLQNSESKEVRWVDMDQVPLYNDSESLLRMQRKTRTTV